MDARNTKRLTTAGLEARRDALTRARIRNIHGEDELLAEREPDILDLGAERAAATLLEALAESEYSEVMRIDAALARIDAGTWGICYACGDRIDGARLGAIPEASRCLECESGLRERRPSQRRVFPINNEV